MGYKRKGEAEKGYRGRRNGGGNMANSIRESSITKSFHGYHMCPK